MLSRGYIYFGHVFLKSESTNPTTEESGVRLITQDFLLFTSSRAALRPTEPHFHWVTGALFFRKYNFRDVNFLMTGAIATFAHSCSRQGT
jgi:hypothetical protein